MIDEIAKDYANYVKFDVSRELQPIHESVDEILTRLEEFESLMKVVENENQEFSSNAFSKIFECRGEVDILKRRIECLQSFVNKVASDLDLVEKQVELAENHIGLPGNKLKSLFKPLLNKISRDAPLQASEQMADDFVYEKPETFKTSDYFPGEGRE